MSDTDADTLHERDAIPTVIIGLAENLRLTADGAGLTGRWIDQINFEAPDGGHDEEAPPAGYYNREDSEKVRQASAEMERITPVNELPEIPEIVDDWQVSDLCLVKEADGTLTWLRPAVWEAYDAGDQIDYLECCADNLRKAADVIDEMTKALHLAKAMIEEAMEHHIYDHDDEIPEDCSFTAGLTIIQEALAKARA